MQKSRYSESQIVKILKEVESGRMAKEVCREYGTSDATYYNWKSKYGGMEAADVKRLKELEEENRRLKQMYAELSLDHKLLTAVAEKTVKPAVRREWVDYLKQAHGGNLRRSCPIAGEIASPRRYATLILPSDMIEECFSPDSLGVWRHGVDRNQYSSSNPEYLGRPLSNKSR